MQSLLFAFLDELLFVFSTEMLVVREMELGRIDREHWEIKATGCVPTCCATGSTRAWSQVDVTCASRRRRGSRFIPGTHEQGTEARPGRTAAGSFKQVPLTR